MTPPPRPTAMPGRASPALRNLFLTAFSDGDPITRGGDRVLHEMIPGAARQPHTTIKGGGHFLQEDQGEPFARVVVEFMKTLK